MLVSVTSFKQGHKWKTKGHHASGKFWSLFGCVTFYGTADFGGFPFAYFQAPTKKHQERRAQFETQSHSAGSSQFLASSLPRSSNSQSSLLGLLTPSHQNAPWKSSLLQCGSLRSPDEPKLAGNQRNLLHQPPRLCHQVLGENNTLGNNQMFGGDLHQ